MCRSVTCKVCGKTTWAGCGQHVKQVMSTVPSANRCPGDHTPAEKKAAAGGSLLSRLLGR